jgi:predicted small lipoprotein YifL
MRAFLASLLALFLLSGCGVTTPTYEPPEPTSADETSVVIDQNYDETWDELIQFTSQRFFAIDNYEKDSGLMTLSFSSEPERFIDCGKIDTDGPPSYEGAYVQWYNNRPQANLTLDGRMNLTVQEVSESKTRVSVNTRYVVEAVSASTGATAVSWSFNTGGSSTKTVPANNFGATDTRTCRPTHEAEQIIIDGITK